MNAAVLCADALRHLPPKFAAADDGSLPTDSVQRVLVVDDEVLIADTIVMILRRHGFEAKAVYSASDAILTSHQWHPALILSDVVMPGMDGVEMAIAITEQLPTTRIVLFSGQADTAELLHRAQARGFHFELLAKPIHPLRLVDRLRRQMH